MGRARHHSDESLGRRPRLMAHLRFGAVMLLTPLFVVLVVLLHFTAPLWWNYLAGLVP